MSQFQWLAINKLDSQSTIVHPAMAAATRRGAPIRENSGPFYAFQSRQVD
jgi:hypothetical protein